MRKMFSLLLIFVAIVMIIFGVLAILPDIAENKTMNTTTETAIIPMVQQFIELGFTEAEAKKMEEIFNTVGITEVSSIQAVGNDGIDKLQTFHCDIYDYRKDKGSPYIRFVIDKRQLCFISIDGLYGDSYSERNNVVLYDIWNEDGEIDESAIGYQAVFDYENEKITKYEP